MATNLDTSDNWLVFTFVPSILSHWTFLCYNKHWCYGHLKEWTHFIGTPSTVRRIFLWMISTCSPSLTGKPGGSFICTNSLSLLKCLKGAITSKTFSNLQRKNTHVMRQAESDAEKSKMRRTFNYNSFENRWLNCGNGIMETTGKSSPQKITLVLFLSRINRATFRMQIWKESFPPLSNFLCYCYIPQSVCKWET